MTIKVLDCTLRDGGYVNNWEYSNYEVTRISTLLHSANIDYIEIGYLSNKKQKKESSIFNSFDEINKLFSDNTNKIVCMVNYGEYDIDDICEKQETVVSGIRVAFHKEELIDALDYAKALKQKGYKVYVQPMITSRYSNYELIDLIKTVNEIQPFAFYIVDSFGTFKENDVADLTGLVNSFLDKEIELGFHSHNNLQLSFSNNRQFVKSCHGRKCIVDSTVFGIGRGAGNLCTEIIIDYLNTSYETNYLNLPILKIYDEVIARLYNQKKWGYSIPYMISAKYNCHPKYADYLTSKNTLEIENIESLISQIPNQKKLKFNEECINNIYIEHNNTSLDDSTMLEKLKSIINDREILIVASGPSIKTFDFSKHSEMFTILVNFDNKDISYDKVFVSNERRYKTINNKDSLICTSNINSGCEFTINFQSLINDSKICWNNSTLMLITLLQKLNTKKVYVAGFDGYKKETKHNYFDNRYELKISANDIELMNHEITTQITKLRQNIAIEFLTPSIYDEVIK